MPSGNFHPTDGIDREVKHVIDAVVQYMRPMANKLFQVIVELCNQAYMLYISKFLKCHKPSNCLAHTI